MHLHHIKFVIHFNGMFQFGLLVQLLILNYWFNTSKASLIIMLTSFQDGMFMVLYIIHM